MRQVVLSFSEAAVSQRFTHQLCIVGYRASLSLDTSLSSTMADLEGGTDAANSSSSIGAAPSALDAAAVASPTLQSTGQPLPLKGSVFMDELAGISYVTHVETLERIALERGTWALADRDDGGCAVYGYVDSSGEECILDLDDVFKKQLLRNERTGDVWIVEWGADGCAKSKSLLVDEKSRHRLAIATLSVHGGSTHHVVPCAVFRRARFGNCRAYWSLPAMYKVFGLTSYMRLSSRWVWRLKDAWLKLSEPICGVTSGLLVLSNDHCGKNIAKNHQSGAEERCLPYNAMCTPMVLHMCVRWASLPKQAGGIFSPVECKAVSSFLSSLLAQVDADPWTIEFQLVPHFVCKWPRPQSSDIVSTLELVVSGRDVELAPLVAAAGAGILVAERWMRALKTKGISSGRVSLQQLLFAMLADTDGHSFFGQLVLALSLHLERRLGAMAKSECNGGGCATFSWVEQFSTGDGNVVNRQLAQYVANARCVFGKHSKFSMATDKGWSNGLNLGQTFIGVRSNVVAMCPPTVARARDISRSLRRGV